MCRLCLFNSDAVDLLQQPVLEYLFAKLENALGGHGMGVASMYPGGRTALHKGVDMTPLEASEWVVKQRAKGAEYFMFHTRLATTGSICTPNCHPFRHGDLVLAHNGQARGFGGIKDKTDSEGVALTLSKTGLPTSFLNDVSGVFVGFRHGKPFVVKGASHSDLELALAGDAFLFASFLPDLVAGCFEKVYDLHTYEWYGRKDRPSVSTKKEWVYDKGTGKSYPITTNYYTQAWQDSSWGDDYYGYTGNAYWDRQEQKATLEKRRAKKGPRYSDLVAQWLIQDAQAKLAKTTPMPAVSTTTGTNTSKAPVVVQSGGATATTSGTPDDDRYDHDVEEEYQDVPGNVPGEVLGELDMALEEEASEAYDEVYVCAQDLGKSDTEADELANAAYLGIWKGDESVKTRVRFCTAYNYYRKQGHERAEAENYAYDFTHHQDNKSLEGVH